MSTSLLRGLRALEMLGSEALGVSEIARRLGVDKAGVSRMLGQLHAEGWVLRTGSRYVLGERALAVLPPDAAEVRRRATLVVDELHAQTGRTAIVLRLAGTGAQPIASRSASRGARRGEAAALEPDEPFEHLWSTAGGIALIAQLPDPALEALLAVDPWPVYSPAAPGDADAVRAHVQHVRAGGTAEERSWTVPGLGCSALPWPVPPSGLPHAVLVLGPADELDHDAELVRRALQACVRAH